MMQQPIEQRRGQHLIRKQLAPFAKRFVATEDNRPLFIAFGHQLKEERRDRAR